VLALSEISLTGLDGHNPHLEEVIDRFQSLKHWWDRDFQPGTGIRCIPDTASNRSSGPPPRNANTPMDDVKGDYHALLLPEGDFLLDAWTVDVPDLEDLKDAKPRERYSTYLSLRKEFGERPGFYLDAADLFAGWKEQGLAFHILSSLSNLGSMDATLSRILGRRLLQLGARELAVAAFEKCVDIQETPQSLRDLALACEADGQFQRAFELLYRILVQEWDTRFHEIQDIAAVELNALAARQSVDTSGVDHHLLSPIPMDIRVLLSWETEDMDMELEITDPCGEACKCNHSRTLMGGRMTRDFTTSRGPEMFLLRRAKPGMYRIKVNHHGVRPRRVEPAHGRLHLEFYHRYGTPWQTRKDVILRVEDLGSVVLLGKIESGFRDSWEMLISPFGNNPCGKIVNIAS